MTQDGARPPSPLFIDANGRRLFALYRPASDRFGDEVRGSVLYLPPFAEEMNRARRMATLLGRALSEAGYAFLNLDLTGTGESDGDFADARWETWQDDVRAAARWLEAESGAAPVLLGLRTGALLAASVGGAPLILWQPVASGARMLNQFLRIRIAAHLSGGPVEIADGLRAEWDAGRAVEVAGYAVNPDLAAALETLELAGMVPAAESATGWIETGGAEDGPSPAAQRVIGAWRDRGARIETRVVEGEPFWTIQETTVAPAMIDATLEMLGRP